MLTIESAVPPEASFVQIKLFGVVAPELSVTICPSHSALEGAVKLIVGRGRTVNVNEVSTQQPFGSLRYDRTYFPAFDTVHG